MSFRDSNSLVVQCNLFRIRVRNCPSGMKLYGFNKNQQIDWVSGYLVRESTCKEAKAYFFHGVRDDLGI